MHIKHYNDTKNNLISKTCAGDMTYNQANQLISRVDVNRDNGDRLN